MKYNQRRYLNRKAVWVDLTEMFGDLCVYCHNQIATQIDHVIPYSYCGYHGIENLRPTCARCNLLVSDKVFEDFESKYEWLRQERWRRRKQKQILTCASCVLPYYSFSISSGILCPECYDLEYDTRYSQRKAWREWLSILSAAGFEPHAHKMLAGEVHRNVGTSIPLREKVQILQGYYSSYSTEVQHLAENPHTYSCK